MLNGRFPEVRKFFQNSIIEGELEGDIQSAIAYADLLSPDRQTALEQELQQFLDVDSLPLDAIGTEANRWFGDDDEARVWLRSLLEGIQRQSGGVQNLVVKDSNGTELGEGDSVTVIKDLKVKGGSSDLKRGTLIKKIHLTSDPDLIECRVGGTTLVLRTEFLKKN